MQSNLNEMSSSDTRFVLASRLAQFLRRNGDKIINGSCKLSLTTSALCLLNSLFIDILQQDFNVYLECNDSSISRVQEDVKYLYDFMKKTTSLKLFHGMQTLRGGVDLSHFTNLTVLELRKIPAHLIIGLNSLSVQLKALICSRSIYLLKELFGSSVDEQNTIDVWTELKELNLSYNYLESLDNSIKSIPNVEILNLSHNNIRNTKEIQVWINLSCVNLSYNRLETLPVFSSLSCRTMCKLYIRYNNLESLDGIECLFNLEELDVGYNLLSEYSALGPLDKLKSLKMLNLEGNPLYFHKKHFQLVCGFIHPLALHRGLNLNGRLIAVPQNLNVIGKDGEMEARRHQTSINTVIGDVENDVHPPEILHAMMRDVSPLISIASDKSLMLENSAASSYTSQNSIEQAIATGAKPKKKKKRKSKIKHGREVVINNPDDYNSEIRMTPNPETSNREAHNHLMIREIYETRREERGESWLIPDNPFSNLSKNMNASENTHESKSRTLSPSGDSCLTQTDKLSNEISTVTERTSDISSDVDQTVKEMTEILDIQDEQTSDADSDRKRHISRDSDDIEVLVSNLQGTPTADQMKILSSEDLSDCEFYKSIEEYSGAGLNDSGLSESEDESEDSIFFVEIKSKSEKKKTISVKIGPKHAKEKDVITGKLIDKLDLSCLSYVGKVTQEKDGVKAFEVNLQFDTVKTSRQQRQYLFQDQESADRLCKILQPFADASTLKEATMGALECMNCKSIFSKQVAHRKVLKTKKPPYSKENMSSSFDSSKEYDYEVDACPNCENHILVEIENIPLPSVAAPPLALENIINPAKSPGGSTGSSSSGYMFSNLLNSFKISPAPKRKNIGETSKDNVGEITPKASEAIGIYQSEKEYLNNTGSESQISRNSSDVTIISNPSQSSIAVIPEPIESNLNTIVERDSQASLSPPVSRCSTVHSNEKDLKNEDHPETFVLTSKGDPDFYSVDESFEGAREKSFKHSEVLSSDSDAYHSPAGTSNMQASKKSFDSDKLMLILGEKTLISYDSFKHLDHRLKLHIEINIFGKDEYISCCLQTSIVPLSIGEECDGVFLLSSKNIYVIKFLAQYKEALDKHKPLTKYVQVLYSGPLSHVKQIKVLLGNQGICVGCGPAAHVYTLIIRDVDTCNTFCNLISEHIHEKNPQFQCLTSAEEMLQILYESVLVSSSDEKPEILLHQFAFKEDKDVLLPICVTLSEEDIFLSKVLYKKQQSCSDLSKMQPYFFASSDCQKISDVISLKIKEHFTLVEIFFLIESSDVESVSWTIKMPTKSAMFSFISALKTPWEEIFAVPLPLEMAETES